MNYHSSLSRLSGVWFVACLNLFATFAVAPVRVQAADPPQTAEAVQLTGCLNEDPGPQYVLRDDKELRLIARLQPDGFPVEAFAKYLGHKITVTGLLSTEDD